MDELTARKKELYRAYDEAALCILMDRYGEEQGEALLAELEALPPEECAVPAVEDRVVGETLALCAKRKRAKERRNAALRTCCKAAVILLVLGSLSGYAIFTASASHERKANLTESGYALPTAEATEKEEEQWSQEAREDRTDEEEKTAE